MPNPFSSALLSGALAASALVLASCAEENGSAVAETPQQIDPVAQAASRYAVTPSTFSHEETLNRLLEAMDRRDLTIFATVDHAAGARSVDQELPEATVIFFGSPRIGTSLMQAVPILTAELPLRASVFVDAEGQVQVATTSVTALGRDYPDLADQAGKLEAISGNLAALRAEAAGSGN